MRKSDQNRKLNKSDVSDLLKDLQICFDEFIALSSNIWLLNKYIDQLFDSREVPTKIRIRLQEIFGILKTAGISFADLTNSDYDDGLSADVASFERNPMELGDNVVVKEMLKPIITFDGKVVQRGQVILGEKGDSKNLEEN